MFFRMARLCGSIEAIVLAASVTAGLPQQVPGQSPLPAVFGKQTPESLLGRLTAWSPRPKESQRLSTSGFLLLEPFDSGEPGALADWSFQLFENQDESRYQQLEHRSSTWHDSTYWSGPDWTRVGKDWQHTGIDTPSVRCFRAPRDGQVRVTGRVYKADTNNGGGDGVRLEIRHRAKTIWQEEIAGDDEEGLSPDLTFDIRQGDAIRFVAHKRGQISFDTTHWDPVIAYADGQRHQASEGFSEVKQGDANWFYEMETSPLAEDRLPTLRWFDRKAMLHEDTVAVERELIIAGELGPGLFVVDDGTGTTGIALAVIPAERKSHDSEAWELRCSLSEQGQLRIRVVTTDKSVAASPRLAIAPYPGSWNNGFSSLQMLVRTEDSDADVSVLRQQITDVLPRSPGESTSPIGLDLWAMVQQDWQQQDDLAQTIDSYRAVLSLQIDQTRKLLDDFGHGDTFAADVQRLGALAVAANRPGSDCRGTRRTLLTNALAQTACRAGQSADAIRANVVLQTRPHVVQSPGDAILRMAGASWWRAVRVGESRLLAPGPGHSQRQAVKRECSGAAAFVRWQADRVRVC